MVRIPALIKHIAMLCVPILILFTACDNMEQPTGTQNQPEAQTMTVELDQGMPQVIEVNPALNKSFATQALCPLTGMKIAYDMSHDSYRQGLTAPSGSNRNSTIFGDFTSRGATITEITTFTLAVLNLYDVLWLEEDFTNGLSAAEQADLQAFVFAGGCVFIIGDDWPSASALTPFGYGYTTPSTYDETTTNLGPHVSITSAYIPHAQNALTKPPPVGFLVKNMAGTGIYASARMYGTGKIVVVSDEFFFDGNVDKAENRDFANKLITWFASIPAPIDIKPGEVPNSINCSGNGNVVITVAILSTPMFDATEVDHTTVMFANATETHVKKKTGLPVRHEEDVDNDGDLDLVFHFRFNDTNLHCSSVTGTLMGALYSGQCIMGRDAVNMVP